MKPKKKNNRPVIEFWYEFASPYSYPAALRIEKVAKKKRVIVKWKPFLVGPVFKSQGVDGSPFNIYPIKGAYMWRDMERICDAQGIKFSKLETFPQNGLLAARLALCPIMKGKRASFSKKVFKAQFGKGKDISKAEKLATILSRIGINAELAFEQAGSDAVKARLRENTDVAIKSQIFGAPSFITPDGELFWGNDRLFDAVAWTAR